MKTQLCIWIHETIKIRNLAKFEIKVKYYDLTGIELEDYTIKRYVDEINAYLCNFYDYSFRIAYNKRTKMFYKTLNF